MYTVLKTSLSVQVYVHVHVPKQGAIYMTVYVQCTCVHAHVIAMCMPASCEGKYVVKQKHYKCTFLSLTPIVIMLQNGRELSMILHLKHFLFVVNTLLII